MDTLVLNTSFQVKHLGQAPVAFLRETTDQVTKWGKFHRDEFSSWTNISIWNISLPIGLEDSGSHTLTTMNLL